MNSLSISRWRPTAVDNKKHNVWELIKIQLSWENYDEEKKSKSRIQ